MARDRAQTYRVPYYVSDRGTVHMVKDKFFVPSDWINFYRDTEQLPEVPDIGGGSVSPGSPDDVVSGRIEDTAFEIVKLLGFTPDSGAAYPVRPGLGFPDFYRTYPTCNDSDFEPRKLTFTRRIGSFSVVAPAPYDIYVNVTGQALTNIGGEEGRPLVTGIPQLFRDPYSGFGFTGLVYGVRRVATAIYNYINSRFPQNPIVCIKLAGEEWINLHPEMLADTNDPDVAERIRQIDPIPGFDTTPVGNYRNGKQHRFSGAMIYQSQAGFLGYNEAELTKGRMMARPDFRNDISNYLMEANYPNEFEVPPLQFFSQITGLSAGLFTTGDTFDVNKWIAYRPQWYRDRKRLLASSRNLPGCIWMNPNPFTCPGRDSLVPKKYIVTYVTQEERPANSRRGEAPGTRETAIPVSGGAVEDVCYCGKKLAANPATVCLEYEGESDDQLHKKLGLFGITCSSTPGGRSSPPGGGGGGGGIPGNQPYGPDGGGGGGIRLPNNGPQPNLTPNLTPSPVLVAAG